MSETIIGIDLGTTNSEVAIIDNGHPLVIEDNGKKILPSFVGIDDQGQIMVGETARNQYLAYPERTVKSIKRLMGQDTKVQMGDQSYTPQEISAIILKRLKNIAEQHVGHNITKAVITVPAYFSDAQRLATREAGEIAGLEVVRMINEPTAAALSYNIGNKESCKMLVYDLGGGTFDVSIVNVEEGVVEVLSSHGDNHLGGDDFDQKIIDYLVTYIHTEYNVDVKDNSKVMARITRIAEQAKFALSDEPFVKIEEEYLFEHKGAAIHLNLELSRIDYEEMIEDYINATIDAVHIALKGAKLSTLDIERVILVGGSTRTPCIRERLFSEFGFEAHGEIDPDLCVAIGASVQAGMLGGQDIDSVLVDITPYTYGTSTLGFLHGEPYPYQYQPIIRKNTALPTRKTKAFVTAHDGQKAVNVMIFQGEDEDALRNIKIGEFLVEGLRDVPAGNTITITLDLDLNGILHVSAMEKASGLEKSITIQNAFASIDAQELDTARDRLQSLFNDTKDNSLENAESEAVSNARKLIKKAQELIDKVGNDSDKEDIINLIEEINDCITHNNHNGLAEPVNQLTDILYYLES